MEIHKDIQNIIFDLGEVIVDLDFSKTEKAFQKLFPSLKNGIYTYQTQTAIFDELETGKISPDAFRAYLKALVNETVSNEDIDEAWNAMLINIPSRKLNLVQNLRKHYKTYVLSNTNEIHIQYLNQFLLPQHQLKLLNEVFDFVYYSHEMGIRKPNKEAFTYIIDKHKIKPSSCLFIDDKLENIETAKELGMYTWHLTNRENLYQLEKYIV